MKQVFIISSLLVFAYIQMFNGLVWMNYEINKSEIIQKFCENQDKPELKCEGTCHMKKMMLDEGGEEGDEPITTLPEIQLFIQDIAVVLMGTDEYQRPIMHYNNLYSFGFLTEIDIPPRA